MMIKRVSFYILWISYFTGCCAINITMAMYKYFGLQLITEDDIFLESVGGVAAISYLLGKIFFGLLNDFTGYSFTLVFQSAMIAILLLTFYATSVVGKIMYLLWVCGIFMCFGGLFSIIPSVVARRYGEKHMLVNFGIVNTSDLAAQIATSITMPFLLVSIQWYGVFLVLGIMSMLNVFLVLFLHCVQ